MIQNNTKRILIMLLVAVMLFSAGCSEKGNVSSVNSTSSEAKSSSDSSSSSDSQVSSEPTESSPVESNGEASQESDDDGEDEESYENSPQGGESQSPSVPSSTYLNSKIKFQANSVYLYGVGYVDLQMSNRVQVYQAVYLLKAMGARSVRIWAGCAIDSNTLLQWRVDRLHELATDLKKAGIQVVFHFNGLENPDAPGALSNDCPARDMTPGSKYMRTMDNYEALCKTMVSTFPEVTYWEIGNELNHNPFLHPVGWTEEGTNGIAPFTLREKADIATDMMYRASKGAKAANKNAVVIMPPLAPADGMDGVSMTNSLEWYYENIKSGNFGSKNPRNFFDALCWHPYMVEEPNMEWVENNNRLYKVAEKYGDAGIKVFLTEYGLPDGGNERADETQAEWMVKAYDLVKTHMPYVEAMHYYRMFTDTSQGDDLYGLFHQPEDGFGPKHKGLAFKKMAGGKGDLYKFFMDIKSI